MRNVTKLIDQQLALDGLHRTEGPGWYVTVQIDGPDGPELYKVWATDEDVPHRGRRMNPPLSEHMASDDLAMIAHHLGPRLAADPSEGAEFALAVVDACIDGLVAKKPVGEYAPATGFEQHLMQARRHLVSAVEGAHPRQRHNPRHR